MSAGDKLARAARWIRWAKEELQWADHGLAASDLVPRPACMHAQQAAEKALKAALIASEVDFPRQHNLNALRNLLPDYWRVKQEFPDLAELSIWIIDARYPGDLPEPGVRDAHRAVEQARGIIESVEAQFHELYRDFQS